MELQDLTGHVAFALIAVSFALKDIFWLRSVSVVASLAMVAYALSALSNWQAIVLWNVLFIAINGTQLGLIVHGDRTAKFSDEERELHETLFRSFTRFEFMKLLRAGEWRRAEVSEVLARQGAELDRVLLIVNGVARVDVDGERVAELRDGQLVGEMSFVTGERASATVTAVEPVRYLAWSLPRLERLLSRNPSLRFGLAQVMGVDMSRKLTRPKHD